MYGAYIGDIVGSIYEFDNIKTKDFPLFSDRCDYTDDSVLSAAVASALLKAYEERRHGQKTTLCELLTLELQQFGHRYPAPTGAYGGMFHQWLRSEHPEPYNSCGNGSAMRASACGILAVTLNEAIALGRASASVTHDHPEGMKGAEALAAAVFLAKSGSKKDEISAFIRKNYYQIDFILDELRPVYRFEGTCQKTVPQALQAFFESESFEDALRNVISIGGDSDTAGAICCAVAWMYYAVQAVGYDGWCKRALPQDMEEIKSRAEAYLPAEFIEIDTALRKAAVERADTYARTGTCIPVMTEQETYQFG